MLSTDSPRAYQALREVLLGIPGSGKTTRIVNEVCREIGEGMGGGSIAVVTFTRAARAEMVERLEREAPWASFPWVRTIHSTCLRLLGRDSVRLVRPENFAEFAERQGYRLSDLEGDPEDGPPQLPRATSDDGLRFVYEWGRTRGLDVAQALGKVPVVRVPVRQALLYERRYRAWKTERDLLDFHDLLEQVLERGLRPPVEVAFIDEAQDLSPLQVRLVEMWFAPCRRVVFAGDDDQAIYTWHGADPGFLRGLAREVPTTVLAASQRVPARVAALAERIVQRNRDRIPKTWATEVEGGEVLVLDQRRALERLDGTREAFVLARNRVFLRPYALALLGTAVPYRVEGKGGPSPLSIPGLGQAIEVARKIAAGAETINFAEAAALSACLSVKASGLERGVKAAIETKAEAHGDEEVTVEALAAAYGFSAPIARIRRGGALAVFPRLSEPERAYLERLLAKYGSIPEPLVTLTSIHGAKGRQRALVVVVSDVTKATFGEMRRGGQAGYEAENRVFYVAVTRARETLVIVRPTTRRSFDFPRMRP